MNRRHWLSLALASTATTVLAPHAFGSRSSAVGDVRKGLFFDPGHLDRIRRQYRNNPLFAELRKAHNDFDYDAEDRWMDTELRYNDQLFDIARLGRTAEEGAFVALMTGHPPAEAVAKRAIREIMRFERWDFFLDGDEPIAVQRASQSTVAVALVIDFLGDRLDGAERREWLQTMWIRGCLAAYRTIEDIRYPRTVAGWRYDPESTYFEHRPGNRTDMNRRPEITIDTNLRAVPASALVIGTVAYEQEFGPSEETRQFMEMGIWGLEGFREFFKADGSYDEEIQYANYTAFHIAQAAVALRRHDGRDLTDIIDWDAYTDFIYNMTKPTHADPYAVVNWGDSGNPPGNLNAIKRTALPFWIASETGNRLAQGFAREWGGVHTPWSVMWLDPSVVPDQPKDEPQLWISELDRVVARTGFGKEDLVVAMRSGPPSNHEHADRNSILVKCYGEELIADPLRPPYTYSDPAWRLRLTEGHSGVLVDGRGHVHHNGAEGTNASTAYARIVTHSESDRHATWVSDASQAYRLVDTNIKSVVRSVAVLYGLRATIIVDRMSTWSGVSTLKARFFGYNLDGRLEKSISENTFSYRRPSATLTANGFCTEPITCQPGLLDIPADTARLHPFVDFTTAPANEVTLVTVLTMAPSGSALPEVQASRPDRNFRISIGGEQVLVEDGALRIG